MHLGIAVHAGKYPADDEAVFQRISGTGWGLGTVRQRHVPTRRIASHVNRVGHQLGRRYASLPSGTGAMTGPKETGVAEHHLHR